MAKRSSSVRPGQGSTPSWMAPPSSGQWIMSLRGVSMPPQLAQLREVGSPWMLSALAAARRRHERLESRCSISRCRVKTIAPSMTADPAARELDAQCKVGAPSGGSTMAKSTRPTTSKSTTPTVIHRTSRRSRAVPWRKSATRSTIDQPNSAPMSAST